MTESACFQTKATCRETAPAEDIHKECGCYRESEIKTDSGSGDIISRLMLSIKSVIKTFGDKNILNSVSFSLAREVVALVGRNGAGKTTLFRIIAGEIDPDDGSVITDEVMAYLPQKIEDEEISVSRYLDSDKNDYEVTGALGQLGLTGINKQQKVASLSGGEKTKLGLVRILLSNPTPTMLLLDEPTNNLDLDTIMWLQEYIANYEGTVFMISHDRALIDDTADRVIELENGEVKQYGGNYSFYKEQKEAEQLAYERRYLAQERMIEKVKEDINTIRNRTEYAEEKFSSRNPYQRRKIRKAAQQGVVRKKKLERFLISEGKLDKPIDRRNYPFHFGGKIYPDKFILRMKNVSKSFAGRQILNDVSFSINGSSHIWLSGANGSGKSTIIKLLTRQLDPDSGEVEYGNDIKAGYFSQETAPDKTQSTIMEELASRGANKTDIYKYAKFMHFETEEVTKPLASLSRGQLAKMKFIKLLMENNDILILDEPTNHLEIDTREQIEEALRYYEGALLIASHDRYFLERIGIDRELNTGMGKVGEKQEWNH